jgi:hypothetical protein
VNHRHLLPDEIDQLLDDEVGFGMAPLRAHIAECADCRSRLDDARAITDLIEKVPHLAPSHRFSERVMTQVPVFVPWHVAARDAMAEWLPAAGTSRKVAITAGVVIGAVLTVITIGLATQTDLLLFAANVAVDRVRDVAVAGIGSIVVNLFGEQTFNAIAQFGAIGFAFAGGVMLVGLGIAFASLRSLAASASRRRG